MQRHVFVVAILLFALGVIGYALTGAESLTALIPSAFGLLFFLLALWARHPDAYKKAVVTASSLGFIGFLATIRGLPSLIRLVQGQPVDRPAAAVSQTLMALICFVFFVVSFKSFVDASKTR
jgi:hypothetical protein